MFILGIDTSCDDTAAAVVENGTKVLSNIVSNQTKIHQKYGGIVPELASRRHIEMIWPVVNEALKTAGMKLDDLSGIAVCHGPGLIGSLLVGCSFAKALCYSKGIPLLTVNHLEGHIFSVFFAELKPRFPFLALIVSGGHTCLYRVDSFNAYRELGRTRDDAAGEAFDKISKLLGLGYPGGPFIEKIAQGGNPKAINFPRAYLSDSFDFSFSGLKTAVLHFVQEQGVVGSELSMSDIAASFQASVIDVLVRKTEWALKQEAIKRVAITGGVAANRELRKRIKEMGDEKKVEVFIPSPSFCTDNAAMIASAGYFHLKVGNTVGLDLNPKAYLPL